MSDESWMEERCRNESGKVAMEKRISAEWDRGKDKEKKRMRKEKKKKRTEKQRDCVLHKSRGLYDFLIPPSMTVGLGKGLALSLFGRVGQRYRFGRSLWPSFYGCCVTLSHRIHPVHLTLHLCFFLFVPATTFYLIVPLDCL